MRGRVTLRGDATRVKLAGTPINLRSLTYDSASRASALKSQARTQARRNGGTAALNPALPDLLVDGAFTFLSMPPGTFTIVPAPPQGTCLVDVLQRERSILNSGLTVTEQAPEPFEVILTTACSSIEGVLQSKNQPRPFTRVVLVTSGSRQKSYGLNRTVITDMHGRFSFENVSPGEYKVFSWASIDEGAWTDEKYLEPYQARGTPVRAVESGRLKNVHVEMILD